MRLLIISASKNPWNAIRLTGGPLGMRFASEHKHIEAAYLEVTKGTKPFDAVIWIDRLMAERPSQTAALLYKFNCPVLVMFDKFEHIDFVAGVFEDLLIPWAFKNPINEEWNYSSDYQAMASYGH